MEVLGIDIGFGFTKATNGKDTIVFKSLFGDASEMQFWMDFGSDRLTDYFHVTIDGKSYYIGDLAEQQSNVLNFTLDQEKLIAEFVKILALTVTGVFLKQESTINVPINVISGLPISYFKNNHKRFNEILTGHHKVIYHKHDGSQVKKEIYINKIQMIPQPLGTILNEIMDENGKITNTEMANQKIGVVDIGFKTTDFAIMDRLRYIDRGSRTMETGISKAFNVIANRLREKCNVNVELYRLYKAAETGVIKMKGHGFDFSKIRDQVYSQLAGTIANDIDRLWAEDWDIDTIILTGGGCIELARYLQPLIVGNILPIKNNHDARLNNVLGYFKYGNHVWGDSPPEPVPPPPDMDSIEETDIIEENNPDNPVEEIDDLLATSESDGEQK